MNKYLLFFLLFLFSIRLPAQGTDMQLFAEEKQEKLIEDVKRIKDADARLKAIDDLLSSHQITTKHYVSWLHAIRAQTTYKSYMEHGGSDNTDMQDKIRLNMIPAVLADYQIAVDSCSYCQPANRKLRHDFLESQKRQSDPLYQDDLVVLKAHGYKEDRDGMGLSLNFSQGKSSQIGLEISAISYYSPFYNLRTTDPADGKTRILDRYPTIGLELLILGYNQNLNLTQTHEFSFSFLRMNGPFLLDLTKFGFTNGPAYRVDNPTHFPVPPVYETKSGFYRPEIGFTWDWFSIGYAYNFESAQGDRKPETHLFFIKLAYPVLKYGNK
jgi:hypothetical protein